MCLLSCLNALLETELKSLYTTFYSIVLELLVFFCQPWLVFFFPKQMTLFNSNVINR